MESKMKTKVIGDHLGWMEFKLKRTGEVLGKIVIGLYEEAYPATVHNFLVLIEGKDLLHGDIPYNDDGVRQWYKNTRLHTIRKDRYIGGGDVDENDGSGGYTNFGYSNSPYLDESVHKLYERHNDMSESYLFVKDFTGKEHNSS
jgi:cyclophilin family peptidyl-prolyl cis-trans isomerase